MASFVINRGIHTIRHRDSSNGEHVSCATPILENVVNSSWIAPSWKFSSAAFTEDIVRDRLKDTVHQANVRELGCTEKSLFSSFGWGLFSYAQIS